MAKAALWPVSDTDARKLGEQMGLDTPVVLAVNVGYQVYAGNTVCAEVNALSTPPGDYGRKAKTQRN